MGVKTIKCSVCGKRMDIKMFQKEQGKDEGGKGICCDKCIENIQIEVKKLSAMPKLYKE